MKASLQGIARTEDRQLREQASAVVEEQINQWEGVVMEWMKPETRTRDCGGMVERCRKVAEEVDYLEASVLPI